jgi:hypothetical protein
MAAVVVLQDSHMLASAQRNSHDAEEMMVR